jgi:hypothetical protein
VISIVSAPLFLSYRLKNKQNPQQLQTVEDLVFRLVSVPISLSPFSLVWNV